MDSTHRPTHLADLVEAAAARHADHPALIDAATGATLTWAEFDAAVSAEARRLAAEGVVAGDRVVIHCGGPALAVAVLGAMRAGAVAVPVAPGDGRPRSSPAARPGCWWPTSRRARGRHRSRSARSGRARRAAVAAVGGGEDLALLLHTSAGRAVCLSHRAVLANRAQAAALRPAPVTPVDRVLLTLPLFHAYGLAAGLFQVCWAGATAVLPGPGAARRRDLADAVGAAPGERAGRRALDVPGAARAPAGAAADRAGRAAAVHVRRGAAAAAVGDGIPRGDRAPRRRGLRPDGGRSGGDEHPARRGRGRGLRGTSPAGDRAAARRPRRATAGGARDGGRGACRRPTSRRTSRRTTSCGPKSLRSRLLRPDRARTGPGRPEPSAESSAESSDPRSEAPAVRHRDRPTCGPPRAGSPPTSGPPPNAASRSSARSPNAVWPSSASRPSVPRRRSAAAKVRAGDPVGDMIDDAQDVEGPADLAADIGRVALRGPNLFSGYWPGRTGGPDADGWFITADMGFLDGSGALHLVDRSSDLVVVSGFTVYPHQVERVLGRAAGRRRGGGRSGCRTSARARRCARSWCARRVPRSWTPTRCAPTAAVGWPGSRSRRRWCSSTSCRAPRPGGWPATGWRTAGSVTCRRGRGSTGSTSHRACAAVRGPTTGCDSRRQGEGASLRGRPEAVDRSAEREDGVSEETAAGPGSGTGGRRG